MVITITLTSFITVSWHLHTRNIHKVGLQAGALQCAYGAPGSHFGTP